MIKKILITLVFTLFFGNLSLAAGGDGSSTKSNYDKAVKLIKSAKKYEADGKIKKADDRYKKAFKLLVKSNKEKPGKADTLNYLGFTSRKLGDFENAEIFYSKGLEISPYHIRINQYMGELYVTTNRINKAKERLGIKSQYIKWIVCDLNDFEPKENYAIWHDRAVFHFLTSKVEIDRYVRKVKLNTQNFIVGTFSTLGPKKCSGLDITQYDESSLKKLFEDPDISMKRTENINHITPFETTQNFIFCSFSSIK